VNEWLYTWKQHEKKYIREKVGVAPHKIRESRFRWFAHIKHWSSNYPVKRVDLLDLTVVKPKKTRLNSILFYYN